MRVPVMVGTGIYAQLKRENSRFAVTLALGSSSGLHILLERGVVEEAELRAWADLAVVGEV